MLYNWKKHSSLFKNIMHTVGEEKNKRNKQMDSNRRRVKWRLHNSSELKDTNFSVFRCHITNLVK